MMMAEERFVIAAPKIVPGMHTSKEGLHVFPKADVVHVVVEPPRKVAETGASARGRDSRNPTTS